jgi:hypothetical protein
VLRAGYGVNYAGALRNFIHRRRRSAYTRHVPWKRRNRRFLRANCNFTTFRTVTLPSPKTLKPGASPAPRTRPHANAGDLRSNSLVCSELQRGDPA